MKGHRVLLVWQKSMRFVTDVYQITHAFPREEMYGLSSQLRRAAVSIPSNIAEDMGAVQRRSFINSRSRASVALEAETQIEIAFNLGYVNKEKLSAVLKQSSEIGRILTGLRSWAEGAGS